MWGTLRTWGAAPAVVISMCLAWLELLCTTHIEKVQLVRVSSADARCKEQQITLQPRDLVAGKLKANTRSCFLAHVDLVAL